MEIRRILPVYSNAKYLTIKIHYILYNIFIRISRTPGDPTTKILSTIDHDLIIFSKKFKEFEAAFFEILSINTVMNSFHMLIKLISHNLWTNEKVYQPFLIAEIFVFQ